MNSSRSSRPDTTGRTPARCAATGFAAAFTFATSLALVSCNGLSADHLEPPPDPDPLPRLVFLEKFGYPS